MGRDFFTFQPTHTLAVLTNNMLETRGGGSPALWRRMRLIPFVYTVPKRDRDPYLEQALMDEAPGILAWLIQGTLDYLSDGLREPESVREPRLSMRRIRILSGNLCRRCARSMR